MLKIEINAKEVHVAAQGRLITTLSEIGTALQQLHAQIDRANPIAGAQFRAGLKHLISDPESPLWGTACESDSCAAVVRNAAEPVKFEDIARLARAGASDDAIRAFVKGDC